MRHYKFWGAGNGYRLALSIFIRARFVWLYPTSNEKSVQLSRKWRLYGYFFSELNNNFFPRTCYAKRKKHKRREHRLIREEFHCTDMICLCSKTYCCYDSQSNKFKFSSKKLNDRTFQDCDDGIMTKHRKALEEINKVTSTKKEFRTIQYAVFTYEQTKKGLLFFHPKTKRSKRWYTPSSHLFLSIDSFSESINTCGWHLVFAFVVICIF